MWLSELVYFGVTRVGRTYWAQALVDLTEPDVLALRYSPGVSVSLSGTFGGIAVTADPVVVADSQQLRVDLGRTTLPTATVAGKLWFDAMVLRMRSALATIRSEAPPADEARYRVI